MSSQSSIEALKKIDVYFVGFGTETLPSQTLLGTKYVLPKHTISIEQVQDAIKGISTSYANYILTSVEYIVVDYKTAEGYSLWSKGPACGLSLVEFLDKLLQD